MKTKLLTFLLVLSLPALMMAQMPVFYLTFDYIDDSDSEVYDQINELIGTASGEIASSGQYGQGYSLNGTDSYINFEDVIIDRASFTLTLWVSAIEGGAEDPALFQTDGGETDGGAVFILSYFNDGLECFANPFEGEQAFWAEVPISEEWMHIAFIIDTETGEAIFYADGELVFSEEANFNDDIDKPLIGPFTIGAHTVDALVDRNWAGTVDEVRLYDKALTEEEVIASMEELENVGVSEIGEYSFKLFPNPSDGRITLNKDFVHLSIFSIAGQEVLSISDYKSYQEISLDHLARGFYLIKVSENKEVKTKKLIIK